MNTSNGLIVGQGSLVPLATMILSIEGMDPNVKAVICVLLAIIAAGMQWFGNTRVRSIHEDKE